MPSTTYADPAFQALAFQTRTDETGTDVIDVDGPELRLPWSMYTPGVRGSNDYQVTASGGMLVNVGSGVAFTDLAVVAAGTSHYGVRLEVASQSFTVPAADLSNPRTDQVYLVIENSPGTMVKARLAYRQGDPAASPSAPGVDGSWEGSLLLATISVGTGVTEILAGNIADNRVLAQSAVQLAPSSVGVEQLTTDAITTTKIQDGAVTEAKLNTGAIAPFFLEAFGTSVAGSPVGSTSVEVLNVSFSIPPSWNAWRAHAIATGIPDAEAVAVRVQLDGVNGMEMGPLNDNTSGFAVQHFVEGRLGTGSRNAKIMARSTTGFQAGVSDLQLHVRAVRTS